VNQEADFDIVAVISYRCHWNRGVTQVDKQQSMQ